MVWISTGISEFEGDVDDIWVPPLNLESLKALDKWIIYGKKGVGKTTILDYWIAHQTRLNLTVAPIRPAEETGLFEVFDRFTKRLAHLDEHARVLAAQRFIDARVKVALMFRWNRFKIESGSPVSSAAEQRLATFVRSQRGGKHESAFALDLLKRLTDELSDSRDVETVLENAHQQFVAAGEDLKEVMQSARAPTMLVACIDDIDDVNFEYGPSDRLLIKALIGYTFTENQIYARNGIRIRTVLFLPSELYVVSQMWGADKVRRYEAQLRWNDVAAIRDLVNRRIGRRLNVTRRASHRADAKTDRFSASPEHTWNKTLPHTITNRRGKDEDALEYLLRHTFYTPRELLDTIDRIKEDPAVGRLSLDGTHSSAGDWSALFQRKVSESAAASGGRFVETMRRVVEGLRPVLARFSKRPNIWARSKLEEFVLRERLILHFLDGRTVSEPPDVIGLLHRIGFLGLGTRQDRYIPVMRPNAYDVRYAFLSDEPPATHWEIAVIPPVFYDGLPIQSQYGVIVRPHAELFLDGPTEELLAQYDVASEPHS